jgi:hypothetical protein
MSVSRCERKEPLVQKKKKEKERRFLGQQPNENERIQKMHRNWERNERRGEDERVGRHQLNNSDVESESFSLSISTEKQQLVFLLLMPSHPPGNMFTYKGKTSTAPVLHTHLRYLSMVM